MSEKKLTALLGPKVEDGRVCHLGILYRGGGSKTLCGRPAVAHIVWEMDSAGGFRASCVCADHRDEVLNAFHWLQWHKMGPCCGMPGAMFFPEENVCKYKDDELPVAERRERELVT